MGFGLSVAPKIMTAIVRKVLSLDPLVGQGTDSYIDDISVNESIVSAERVRDHLHRFGLQTKAPVALSDARVLGLRVVQDSGGSVFLEARQERQEDRWIQNAPVLTPNS